MPAFRNQQQQQQQQQQQARRRSSSSSSGIRAFPLLAAVLAVVALAVAAQIPAFGCDAFSVAVVSPLRSARTVASSSSRPAARSIALSMTAGLDAVETVAVRSLSFTVTDKPFGIVLEELADGVGVFCAEVETDGPAYAAGLRDGDVLAAVDDDDFISDATLDQALAILGASPTPLPVRVYRELENETDATAAPAARGGTTVRMAPRRLPSAKKLMKASTNKNFWNDPVMIGSAVLTVAMPLGIFAASSLVGK